MSNEFNAMGIIPELTDRLHQDGIASPTPVQQKAIPVLLAGQDVIAQAQTGTGKTIAFALPILQRIDVTKEQVQALILTPTRELAIQITSELAKLAPAVGAKVLAAYGGQDVVAQIRKLNNAPHIVVATPGRLIDHMKRETISLGKLKMLVLDEADQMLHMGFLPEVESIVDQTPRARQTMLFSATMPDAIKRLAENYMKTPVDIRIKSANVTLDNIKQYIIETTDRGRQQALIHLIEQHRPYLAVVFCRTKVRAKKLNEALQDYGFASDELHGDLTQAKREQVMKRFRDAKLQILVATDVAARGLDVEGVTHVFNYDVPQDSEIYIHRIGRTGRAGQRGVAVTLVSPYDRGSIQHIERNINAVLDRRSIDPDGTIVANASQRTAKTSGKSDTAAERGGRRGRDAKGGAGSRSDHAAGGRGRSGGGKGRSDRNIGGNGSGRGRTERGTQNAEAGGRKKRGEFSAAARSNEGVESTNPWTQDRESGRGSRNAEPKGRGARNASSPKGPASWGGRTEAPGREARSAGNGRTSGRHSGSGGRNGDSRGGNRGTRPAGPSGSRGRRGK
ncbi:DEAD/DEAH box helicase [Paenibacillus sp. NEAU-GSW1]|uniref:DEAD/DEAH box helicase n=1 Tax=Paenibacillus sp. NEAU-GSW1 TaxID=2682486 RepID=UPI0012E0FB99|nr:DEAD/DEAH box helicase [Paenibacillus sp. NEAU-GSW1]MUT66620.1 DEAD/DEAH box helicase [Paenibacillus sp. NEAU-GSW1]